eukprot:scaffold93489_cov27-Tisochrysis_lutea.AAC.3
MSSMIVQTNTTRNARRTPIMRRSSAGSRKGWPFSSRRCLCEVDINSRVSSVMYHPKAKGSAVAPAKWTERW